MEVILLSLLISCDKYTCKNHIHQKIASDCLENIMRNNFLVPGRGGSNNVLLTVLVYNNIRSPSYGIQHNIIGRIHDEYQMEIVSPRNENELQSNDDCEYRSDQQIVENYKTSFYLIILDDEHIFGNLLKILKRLKTFNPNAYYLIYFENQEENPEMIAENILEKMWNNLISFSGVLVTEKLQTFGFYQLSSKNRRTSICGSQVEINMMGKCQKGVYNAM
ncbi:hypothetical protein JTB14_000533 [Gonioctena quinquepunctata]|nr:hypothetical protein JTB14_000533 [Gonioctena quinquepunctata]